VATLALLAVPAGASAQTSEEMSLAATRAIDGIQKGRSCGDAFEPQIAVIGHPVWAE